MIKILSKLFLVAFAAILGFSCSQFQQIAKSGDPELIYVTAFDLFDQGKYSKAQKLFGNLEPYYIGTDRADTIAFYYGTSSYKMGDFDNCTTSFDEFRRKYSRSPFLEDVEYMYAMSYYYTSPKVENDQNWTMLAIDNINEYLSRYPNSVKKDFLLENIVELQGKLYEKSYLNAYVYYKIGRYKSAITAFKNALIEYPDSPRREDILFYTVKSGYLLAKGSYENLQRDRYLNVLDYYYNFVAEYPESAYIKELEKMEKASQAYLDDYDKKQLELENKEKNTEDGN